MEAKETAARSAVAYVRDGMRLGLGTGSTAVFFLHALQERMKAEGLRITGIPTSTHSAELAVALSIPLEYDFERAIDLTVDGADQVDPALNVIKGGGGALLREKIVACASREYIIIVDENKPTPVLGSFPLPVAIIPFGWRRTLEQLKEFAPQSYIRMSQSEPDKVFISDDQLYIVDMHFGAIQDAAETERLLRQITGVAEVGLFIGLTTRLIVGHADGSVSESIRTGSRP